jgi:hypothetical protein
MIPLLLHLVIFVVFHISIRTQHLATICHATTCHARRNMTSCFKVRAGFPSLPCLINTKMPRLVGHACLLLVLSFASCLY